MTDSVLTVEKHFHNLIMNKFLINLVTQMGWVKRQALKASAYTATAVSGYLIAQVAKLHDSGLISDETLTTATDGANALAVASGAVVVIVIEVTASYFAKGRKE